MAEHIRLGRCTVERHNGSFCDGPSAEDVPFPICGQHAMELYRSVRDQLDHLATDPASRAALVVTWAADGKRKEEARQAARVDCVYYAQVGKMIKIGTTGHLRQRLASYPPGSKLLATEPGNAELERRRLDQFAHLRVGGKEWFRPEVDLLQFIESLRGSQ